MVMSAHYDPLRILVVDDHALIGLTVARVLNHRGFLTVVARSGEEALGRLAQERFDAVVSDVRMPEMSGLELLENIRAQCLDLPVVLMTATAEPGLWQSALALGAAALLEKPFSREQLLTALRLSAPGNVRSTEDA
jgi:CheY-like chemotaxis protein